MIAKKRATFLALCFLVAACAAPTSPTAPVRTVEIAPSSSLDDDLKKLDELVLRRDFLAVPTSRDRTETAAGPVDVLRSYELRTHRTVKASIGWDLRRSRYRIFVTNFGRNADQARGLECTKYREIFADVAATFGTGRVAPATAETCEPG